MSNYFKGEAAVLSLRDFLETKKADLGLSKIYDYMPYNSDKLVLPCVCVSTAGESNRIPHNTPINIKVVEGGTAQAPIITETQEIAEYTETILIDIFAGYKATRNDILEKITDLFISDDDTGLIIEMTKYHNSQAEYEYIRHNHIDTDNDEWRSVITLNCTYPEVKEKVSSRMTKLDLKLSIGDNIDDEIKEIF